MTEYDPEAAHAIVEADPRLKAAVEAVEADAEQFAEYLAGWTPLAIREAVVKSATTNASPIVADRLGKVLLHPAASQHWTEAMDLFSNLAVPVETAVKALDALAGTGGGRSAN